MIHSHSGCLPAMPASGDWWIQLLTLLLNKMEQDSLLARWEAPDDLGESHWTQKKREKLCKIIAFMLSMSVVTFV